MYLLRNVKDKLEKEIKTKTTQFAAEESKIAKETDSLKKKMESKEHSLEIWNTVTLRIGVHVVEAGEDAPACGGSEGRD